MSEPRRGRPKPSVKVVRLSRRQILERVLIAVCRRARAEHDCGLAGDLILLGLLKLDDPVAMAYRGESRSRAERGRP